MSNNPRILLEPQDLEPTTLDYVMQAKEDQWQAKYNLKKEIYIDTYDAIRLIQGVWGLWEYDRKLGNRENPHAYVFNKNIFEKPDILVNSLLFNNRLNAPVRLLPPHQDELAQKIQGEKSWFAAPREINEQIYDLWSALNLTELLDEAQGYEPMSPHRIKEYLEKIRGIDFYIAKDLLQVPYWYDRYKKLFKQDRIVSWDDSSYNFASVTRSKEFKIILQAFDEERNSPKMLQSNYVDAIAFYLLWERLEAFKKDASLKTALPVFFVSKPGIFKALKKLMDNDMFTYTFERDGQRWKFPIIRRAQFFILDAIFNYESQGDDDGALHKLFEQMRTAFNYEIKNHKLVNSILGRGIASAEDLGKRIDQLVREEFFDKIWAKHEGYKELYRAIEVHKESKRLAEQGLRQHEEERQKIVAELRRDTRSFELANEIMHEVFRLDDIGNKELNKIATIDVFSDLSMARFSFTKPCRDNLQQYTIQILNTRGQDGFKFAARNLLSDIMEGLENFNNGKESSEKFTVGLAVLWVFKKYELIAKIAERLNQGVEDYDELSFPNYHIPLLCAAALCRMEGNGKAQLAKRFAECIEKKFSAQSNKPNYKAWLGLAYVWWHIWNTQNRSMELPEEMGKADFLAQQREPAFQSVRHAQHLCIAVVNHLRNKLKEEAITGNHTPQERGDILEQRNQKYHYALNMAFFLTVLYGNKQDLLSKDTERLFNALNAIEGGPLWHSRYYDTCARYHYRRALLAENAPTFKNMLQLAKEDNKRCIESTLISEGFNYNRQLNEAISSKQAEGYKAWKEKSRLING